MAAAGLAVISQIAPMPQVIPDTPPAPPETAAPAPLPAPEAPAAPATAPDSGAGVSPDAPAPAAPQPALGAAPAPDAPAAQPQAAALPPDAPDATAPDAPKAPAAPGLPPAPGGAEPAPAAAPAALPDGTAAPDAVTDAVPPAIDLPPPPPLTPEEEALLAPQAAPPEADAPVAPPMPAATPSETPAQTPSAEARLPAPALAPVAPLPTVPAPDTDADADALPDPAPGVMTGRLPRIGTDTPLPEVEVLPEAAADTRPVAAFARPFDNPDGKPVFAILLVDTGAPDLDRKALADLPFPVTFVIDPMAPGAAGAAATYRAGMQEVVFAATGIPPGATAADLEQTFQSHARTLPETVGVIDLPGGGFQDDRAKASAILPILADQGRGLVTYDRGLNAADQIARREGQPAAVIFRQLDAAGESVPTIRRYLDRAAFKAAQEGGVAVIGTTAPDTVAAILEWTVEGRAATVALAPVTALMSR